MKEKLPRRLHDRASRALTAAVPSPRLAPALRGVCRASAAQKRTVWSRGPLSGTPWRSGSNHFPLD
eukprot:CAMPEP_0182815758 /NCGR_PEP_ID=MMETSP0006_2-20121128/10560_1 /TAXON_ID=97485 /ORGANISM="Prymnesium parvum, Strain Texoma1" /LENGTH=65 /DNA_ID=CAMNT_0024941975 /DNA_START=309 /DNA_END=503 /DNA_ORIENTATION=+